MFFLGVAMGENWWQMWKSPLDLDSLKKLLENFDSIFEDNSTDSHQQITKLYTGVLRANKDVREKTFFTQKHSTNYLKRQQLTATRTETYQEERKSSFFDENNENMLTEN